MRRDLSNRLELQRLLQHFYALVLKDPIIGYLFVDVAKIDLDHHLPKVVDFWHDMLFSSKDYSGNLFEAHHHVHQKVPLKPGHFTRWLYLLEKSMSECDYSGEHSTRMLKLAHRISKSMSAGLSQRSRGGMVLSLNDLLEAGNAAQD